MWHATPRKGERYHLHSQLYVDDNSKIFTQSIEHCRCRIIWKVEIAIERILSPACEVCATIHYHWSQKNCIAT